MTRNLILAAVAASVLSASADYKYQYFWTGATSTLIQEPSNWNDANGNPCTRYSKSECAFYFDNTAPLTLTANDQLYADGYHFRGSGDITLPQTPFNMRRTSGSGGIYHTGTGTAYFNYTVNFTPPTPERNGGG